MRSALNCLGPDPLPLLLLLLLLPEDEEPFPLLPLLLLPPPLEEDLPELDAAVSVLMSRSFMLCSAASRLLALPLLLLGLDLLEEEEEEEEEGRR